MSKYPRRVNVLTSAAWTTGSGWWVGDPFLKNKMRKCQNLDKMLQLGHISFKGWYAFSLTVMHAPHYVYIARGKLNPPSAKGINHSRIWQKSIPLCHWEAVVCAVEARRWGVVDICDLWPRRALQKSDISVTLLLELTVSSQSLIRTTAGFSHAYIFISSI